MSFRTAVLSEKAESALKTQHPWIFSGAIHETDAASGDVIRVFDSNKVFRGIYCYSKHSDIALRLLMTESEMQFLGFEATDANKFVHELILLRLREAHMLRRSILDAQTTGYRALNAEGDLLPGVVIDALGDTGVIQLGTVFAERIRGELVDGIRREYRFQNLWEKSSGSGRKKEKLEPVKGCLYGNDQEFQVKFSECGLSLWANVKTGQKTGYFFDQKDNRQLVWKRSKGCRILNLFGYSGSFGLGALYNGATYCISIDSSKEATITALDIAARYDFKNKFEAVTSHVDDFLEKSRGDKYDIVVCDPPAFAKKRADKKAAVKGYVMLNRDALGAVRSGGEFFTFSCSQHISEDEFEYCLARAATLSKRTVRILRKLTASADHPVLPGHPEGRYLKGFWCRVEH